MKALVVIDMQNDFVYGVLGTPEAQAIVPNVKNKIDAYLKNGDKVYYTQDTHDKNYLQTREGKFLPVEHCIRGTEGWEIIPDLLREGCTVIEKPTFGSLDLANALADQPFEEIELIGVCTDICVVSNAMILKARYPETPIMVDAHCCAGATPDGHETALKTMKICQVVVCE